MATKTHLTRQELLAIARGSQSALSDHLAQCPDCLADLRLLKRYLVAGRLPLPEPTEAWVTKAISLAQAGEGLGAKLTRLVAMLTFDSWSLPAPAGVRGLAPLNQRRVRFESGPVSLEIRAEKKLQGWSFVAQAVAKEPAVLTLKAGRTLVSPDTMGFFRWASKTPPRSLILTAGDRIIELPELSWKMPKS